MQWVADLNLTHFEDPRGAGLDWVFCCVLTYTPRNLTQPLKKCCLEEYFPFGMFLFLGAVNSGPTLRRKNQCQVGKPHKSKPWNSGVYASPIGRPCEKRVNVQRMHPSDRNDKVTLLGGQAAPKLLRMYDLVNCSSARFGNCSHWIFKRQVQIGGSE